MRQAAIALAFGVLAAFVVLAGTTDDAISDARYVDYAKGFAPYTAKLKVPCGGKVCEATATIISDHWALTAAHVVDDAETAKAIVGDKTWDIDRVVRHPRFEENAMGHNDIALLHTSKPFGLSFYPALSAGEEAVGDTVSIVGFGVHGCMSVGHSRYDEQLRAGTNHIERFERGMIVCTATPGRSKLEICISPGDSGGPLFCRGKLAGVNCLTMAAKGPLKSKAGEESGHTQVSLYREWIEEVMR